MIKDLRNRLRFVRRRLSQRLHKAVSKALNPIFQYVVIDTLESIVILSVRSRGSLLCSIWRERRVNQFEYIRRLVGELGDEYGAAFMTLYAQTIFSQLTLQEGSVIASDYRLNATLRSIPAHSVDGLVIIFAFVIICGLLTSVLSCAAIRGGEITGTAAYIVLFYAFALTSRSTYVGTDRWISFATASAFMISMLTGSLLMKSGRAMLIRGS